MLGRVAGFTRTRAPRRPSMEPGEVPSAAAAEAAAATGVLATNQWHTTTSSTGTAPLVEVKALFPKLSVMPHGHLHPWSTPKMCTAPANRSKMALKPMARTLRAVDVEVLEAMAAAVAVVGTRLSLMDM